nr:flagellin lysine-N-methylase [Clostridiales bacterium]
MIKLTKPCFFDDFKCKAEKCTDSCCVGWEIDVDEATLEKYRNLNDDFSQRLFLNISSEQTPHFILDKEERCPFLDSSNLCEIIVQKGEDYLCEICREHPRFYEWYSYYKDAGIGLCCEEACRLLFLKDNNIHFIEEETDELPQETSDFEQSVIERMLIARKTVFEIIAYDNLSLFKKLELVKELSEEIQEKIDFEEFSQIDELCLKYRNIKSVGEYKPDFKEILSVLKELEAYDEEWNSLLEKIEEAVNSGKAEKHIFKSRIFDYENLISYSVFRYFMKSLFDFDLT